MSWSAEQLWPRIEEAAPAAFLEDERRRAILLKEARSFARLINEEPHRLDDVYTARYDQEIGRKVLGVSPVTRGKANDVAVAQHSVWRACHAVMSREATAE
ncbi:MAG TPA: hypothetical protein VHA78_00530 [Candidatus Peribacteraceae bacterium]|nr:hypothetical protein [Candidatus Peribacteraceae bacterium]